MLFLKYIFFFFGLVVFSFSSFADEVMLMDSTHYSGYVKKVRACEVILLTEDGVLKFNAEEVGYIEFESIEGKVCLKVLKDIEAGKEGCFSVLKFHTNSKKDNSEKVVLLVGPNYKFNGGGRIYKDNISSIGNDEENAVLYQMHVDEKRKRRNRIIMLLFFASILDIF